MINRENLVKIGRAGGKTSNRETPDQIGRLPIKSGVLESLLPLAHSWNGRPLCGERIDSFISKIHARKLYMCDSGWYQQEPGLLHSENIL